MSTRASILVMSLCLVSTTHAQNRLIAYPQDTWSMPTGDVAPLGSDPTIQTAEEGRWQALIPNTHLPTTPSTIVGFSVICQVFSGPLTYRSLRITLSPTTASALATTFATNLSMPTTVLDRVDFTINYATHAWTLIPFDVPFTHDGRSDLVIEIRKECVPIASGIALMATAGAPPRTDLPRSIYTLGAVNSGAANAVTATSSANAPLQMQIHVRGAPTIFLTSYPQATRNEFSIGSNMELSCDAPTGSAWVGMLSGSFATRFAVPGVLGEGLAVPAVVLPARGITMPPDRLTLAIPNSPRLIGAALAWQGVVADIAPVQLWFTNGANCVIRP